MVNGESVLIEPERINMDFKRKNFILNTDFKNISLKKFKINFLSPVRLKRNGKILINVDYLTFIKSVFRRIDLLYKIYGESKIKSYIDFTALPPVTNENSSFVKESFNYYSSRQKRRILLIGSIGFIEVEKELTGFEASLLKAAEIFGIGSNTTFGFGKVILV